MNPVRFSWISVQFFCTLADVIKSFHDRRTEALFRGRVMKGIPADVARIAIRKLIVLNAIDRVEDLRVPPGNRLEELRDDRIGQYSIRVNNRWRICFVWRDGDAHRVEFTDCH
jgi:proteic killer suppression protein